MSEATNPGETATPPAATPPSGTTPPPAGTEPPATPPAAETPPATPPAAVTPPATPPPAGTEPPKSDDKPPAADWRDSIVDDNLKNVASRFTSVQDMAKAVVDLRTDNSKRIKVPEENAPPEEVAKFRKALGIPDDPKEYKIEPPEGVTLTEGDQGLVDTILPIAHKHGVPAAALNGLVGELVKISHERQAEAIRELETAQAEGMAALKKEWGPDFDPNSNLAKRFVQVHGGDELKALMDTKLEGAGLLGDHPVMVKFLATLGRRSDEGDLMIGSTPDERQNAQAELDELNKSVPVGSPGYTNPEHQKKITALYDRIHGSAPIVGSQNRAA